VQDQARNLASLAGGAPGAYVDSVGHLTASRILHREFAKQNFPPSAMSWDVVGYSRIRTVPVESGRVHECGVIAAANVGYYIIAMQCVLQGGIRGSIDTINNAALQ
jgi:hypothetical protein